jgi:hypothetical protein
MKKQNFPRTRNQVLLLVVITLAAAVILKLSPGGESNSTTLFWLWIAVLIALSYRFGQLSSRK